VENFIVGSTGSGLFPGCHCKGNVKKEGLNRRYPSINKGLGARLTVGYSPEKSGFRGHFGAICT